MVTWKGCSDADLAKWQGNAMPLEAARAARAAAERDGDVAAWLLAMRNLQIYEALDRSGESVPAAFFAKLETHCDTSGSDPCVARVAGAIIFRTIPITATEEH